MSNTCTWLFEEPEDEGDRCITECKEDWVFDEQTFKESGLVFCPFCGKRIAVKYPEEES